MKQRRAFSLIEIIISVTIIAIVMYTAIAVFLTSNVKGVNVDVFSTAQALAEGKMEEVMARPFDSIVASASSYSGVLNNYQSMVIFYPVDKGALDQPAAGATAYKLIRVIVTHPKLTQPLTLESVKADL